MVFWSRRCLASRMRWQAGSSHRLRPAEVLICRCLSIFEVAIAFTSGWSSRVGTGAGCRYPRTVPQALTYLRFFPQTSHKIVILSEAPHRFIAWYSAWWRGVEGPRGCLSCQCCAELFDYPSPRTEFFLRYALDGHGYIFSCTVIIFHPQVCAKSVVERVPTA